MKFRKTPDYPGEIFLALTIPATEDPMMVPCACKVNADGSYRLVYETLYSMGDSEFACQLGRAVIADHPTWKAGLYRAPSNHGAHESVFLCEVRV